MVADHNPGEAASRGNDPILIFLKSAYATIDAKPTLSAALSSRYRSGANHDPTNGHGYSEEPSLHVDWIRNDPRFPIGWRRKRIQIRLNAVSSPVVRFKLSRQPRLLFDHIAISDQEKAAWQRRRNR